MNKTLALHSVNYLNNDFLLELVQISYQIANEKNINKVVVYLHPYEDKYIKFFYFFMLLFHCRFYKPILRKIKNFKFKYCKESHYTTSRSQGVFSSLKATGKLKLLISNIEIKFIIPDNKLLENPLNFIYNIILSIRLWGSIKFKTNHDFLGLSYKNIRIGDLAASFAFRLDDLSHGSIKKVKFLLLNLVHCISIIRYSLKFSKKNRFF